MLQKNYQENESNLLKNKESKKKAMLKIKIIFENEIKKQ